MKEYRYLTEKGLETLLSEAEKAFPEFGEGLSSKFQNRDKGKIKAALYSPQRVVYGREIHKTLSEKGAVLFYEIIKAHALPDGNKRTALLCLYVFLAINDRLLTVPQNMIYKLAIIVAEAPSEHYRKTRKEIAMIINKNTKKTKL